MPSDRVWNWRPDDTEIVRDMRSTAREVGIVSLLLEHQRVVHEDPTLASMLVQEALVRLGATGKELAAHLYRPFNEEGISK